MMIYNPTKMMYFEGLELPVPNNTYNYLVAKFGKNFMTPTPSKKRKCSHIKDINLDGPNKNS